MVYLVGRCRPLEVFLESRGQKIVLNTVLKTSNRVISYMSLGKSGIYTY